MRDVIELTWSINEGSLVEDDLTTTTTMVPVIYKGNNMTFRLNIVEDGVVKDLDYIEQWEGGFGVLGSGTPLVSIPNNLFNLSGDWDADPTVGKITTRLSTQPPVTAIDNSIGTLATKQFYLEIHGITDVGTTATRHVIAVIPVCMRNTIWVP